MSNKSKTIEVGLMTRVEGEGRFRLEVDKGVVKEATLSIFEAPRYFEAFLRGRALTEVPDIVARICGICPIAYQASAVRALEDLLHITPPEGTWPLRRLLYCGEWIESHALHIYMLHAPDFLGYESAIAMAADHPKEVERGIRLRALGNDLMKVIGGRAVHPVSVAVGGFTKAPDESALKALLPRLEQGIADAQETIEWVSGLPITEFEMDYNFVSIHNDHEYPIEYAEGINIKGEKVIGLNEFEEYFHEEHVEHSNALQCRMKDGSSYLVGPLSRFNLYHEKLTPLAKEAVEKIGLSVPVKNPYKSIIVRSIELLLALEESVRIIKEYQYIGQPKVSLKKRSGTGFGATEAPRGICWHKYDVDSKGTVLNARIVPPTSQNQAQAEADLAGLAPLILEMEHDKATLLCEQLLRCYDPCISCATHFLKLDINKVE